MVFRGVKKVEFTFQHLQLIIGHLEKHRERLIGELVVQIFIDTVGNRFHFFTGNVNVAVGMASLANEPMTIFGAKEQDMPFLDGVRNAVDLVLVFAVEIDDEFEKSVVMKRTLFYDDELCKG